MAEHELFAMDNLALFERHGATVETCGAAAGCWVKLPNGWTLSIQWDRVNYGSNHNAPVRGNVPDAVTAEVAAWHEKGSMVTWDGGDTVLGYVSVERAQHILDLLAEGKLMQDYQPPVEQRAVDGWAERVAAA